LVGSLEIDRVEVELRRLARPFPRDTNFVLDEVNYLLGRFLPAEVNEYVTRPRTGRGNSPQMDSAIRTRLLDEVVWPFLNWKRSNGIRDFHDVALSMLAADPRTLFDVVVIDEAQDFSANQLRAVLRHSAPNATITIVTDNTQRIYPRGAAWAEAGIAIAPQRSFRLSVNYRNTREVATLAAALVSGLTLDDDSSVPNPTACSRSGEKPILLKGKYSQQLEYILSKLRTIDLDKETVGFLHLKGGGCFNFLRSTLRKNGFDFCELQGAREWPEDGPNIGLCTFHSAKGLEFDHVYMIGLAQRDASYGEEADDDRYESLRRLLAMGIGRARQTVIMGVKPTEALEVLNVVGDDVVEEVIL
jgi:superfamily I DNA/RNA helicase